jgi:hypothetical protein
LKIYKTIKAGPLCRVVTYPKLTRQERRQRGPRRNLTDRAQAKLNLQRQFEKLEALIAANFSGGFWWVTLTYRDADLPESRDAAQKLLARKFIGPLRRHWRARGAELKYIYCTQEVQSDGSKRLHHHMILNRCGADDFDVIRSLWVWGDDIGVDIQWLSGRDQITDKAHYMTHEARDHGKQHPGKRDFVPSRNLERPQEETMEVPDDVTPAAPAGAEVLDFDTVRNEWGEYCYIKYWLPPRHGPDDDLWSRGRY